MFECTGVQREKLNFCPQAEDRSAGFAGIGLGENTSDCKNIFRDEKVQVITGAVVKAMLLVFSKEISSKIL